jgi:FKBP-type peptidyl-prolyl cis-trans isomerase FkpA
MKLNLIFATLIATTLVACGSKEKKSETVEFSSEKQKLSYALGSDYAQRLTKSGIEKILDIDAVYEAFGSALNDKNYADCEQTVLDAFGMNFMEVNESKKVEGSECFAKLEASGFYNWLVQVGQLDKVDLEYLRYGYRDALLKKDTILNEGEKASLLTNFHSSVQTIMMNQMKEAEKPFFDKAKALPNTEIIDGGIVIETLKKSTGASPKNTDEVKAHYVLTDTKGDTIDSSFKRGEPLSISLQSVIPGWTMAFPRLNKGGVYNIYIPAELAYGMSKGALKFYVEFIDFKEQGAK